LGSKEKEKMDVHVVEGHFSDRPTADWIMHDRAKKYGICLGEAHYRPIGRESYFKVYISILRSILPAEASNQFMKWAFDGAVLCSTDEFSLVYEIPTEFEASKLKDFVGRAKEVFKEFV